MIRFSIRNPVVVNLLAITVVVVGGFAFFQLPREMFPEVSLNWVYVITNWYGASPKEMERLVTIPLEDEVASVNRIESITSRSYQGRSVLSIKFESMPKDEFRSLLQDLRAEVDQVTDLPEAADDPYILNFTADDFMPLINVNLSTDSLQESATLDLAHELSSEIKQIDGVKDVAVTGDRDEEVWVEVDPGRLNAIGVPLSRVVEAIAAKNVGLPVGSIDVGRQEYVLRVVNDFQNADDIENVVLTGDNEGGLTLVKDVARVTRTLQKPQTSLRFNGKPGFSLVVTKIAGANSLRVIDSIKSAVNEFASAARANGSLDIEYTGDTSRQIHGVLDILQRNALFGMILVIATLYFFLGFRNALFAALGIPITFMVTFIFLWGADGSFNGNSLFGLVLVLGVVVDDAIIVIENAYSYIQQGHSPVKAAYYGAREVATPVLSATATTVAGFLPLMLMPGIMGQFLKIVPIVVSLALIASLFEAFLVLPSHIADWSGKPKRLAKDTSIRRRMFSALSKRYVPLVSMAIRYRYITVGIVLLCLLGVKPTIEHLGVEMFRDEELPTVFVQVRMPTTVNLAQTDAVLREMETRLKELNHPDIHGLTTSSGFMMTETEWYFKSSVGQIQLDLADIDQRTSSNDELIGQMREMFADVVGPISIQYQKISTGPPSGEPLEVKVKGKYLDDLNALAGELRDSAATIDGLYDVRTDYLPGKRELRYRIDPAEAARLGVNPATVAQEMLIAFEGVEATTFRDGDEEVHVRVKFDEEKQNDFNTLNHMRISSANIGTIALSDVAQRTERVGVDEIRRFNQDRSITVKGKNDPDKIQIDKIAARVAEQFASISQSYPGYTIDFRGEWNEFKNSFSDLKKLFVVGLLLIYMILGAQFKSFLQPFIILFTIPFAVLGAMLGLILMGAPFSISTMYGIVALGGVAVNDSLVLVDFVNKGRTRGAGRYRSLVKAGKRRLRPILSTSITTIFGLLPMAIGIGGKSVVWGPLATTIVWGLSAATILTLFVIPALYAITDDLKALLGLRLSHTPHDI